VKPPTDPVRQAGVLGEHRVEGAAQGGDQLEVGSLAVASQVVGATRTSAPEDTLDAARGAALRHHGMYAYRRHVLAKLVAAEPCVMEECEKLEQLRALWLGIRLKVGRADVRPGPGVDTEEDLAVVSKQMNRK